MGSVQIIKGGLLGTSAEGFTTGAPPAPPASANSGTLVLKTVGSGDPCDRYFASSCANPLAFTVSGSTLKLSHTDTNFCEQDDSDFYTLQLSVSGRAMPRVGSDRGP